jgi:hypothetical protein
LAKKPAIPHIWTGIGLDKKNGPGRRVKHRPGPRPITFKTRRTTVNISVATGTATVLDFPTPTVHPSWCDRGACHELEPGYGYHVSPGAGVVDKPTGIFWTTEIRAPFLPGYTGKPEVHVRVIDADEAPVRQSVRPMAGSRAETRLNAAVAKLEGCLR